MAEARVQLIPPRRGLLLHLNKRHHLKQLYRPAPLRLTAITAAVGITGVLAIMGIIPPIMMKGNRQGTDIVRVERKRMEKRGIFSSFFLMIGRNKNDAARKISIERITRG